jgi:hypothetical protein
MKVALQGSIRVALHTKRYFKCLTCKEGTFWVEHLFGPGPKTWGPWYCDECGQGHRGRVEGEDVRVELTGDKREWTAVLLKLEPDAGDVYLTVRGMHFTKNDGPMPEGAFHEGGYFYNEHTCPTNYLRRVIEILQIMPDGEQSTDPHGIFEYVMSRPLYTDEGWTCDDVNDRLELFSQGLDLPEYCPGCKTINPDTYNTVEAQNGSTHTFLSCMKCGRAAGKKSHEETTQA